jgi:sugar-specific transcriptional regulator TrmB
MDKIEEILQKIGLTVQESRVYLALLELQEAQTGVICKTTNIASSNIYKILDSLMQKGLVNYRVQNNIKIFMPAPPETLNELFIEKQKKLDDERAEVVELISHLKKRELKKESYSNYKYYEGLTGIKSMWHEINSMLCKKSKLKMYTCKKEGYQRFVGFYDEHHKVRQKCGAEEKLIFPYEDKNLAKERLNLKKIDIRFLDLENEAEWGVVEDHIYIQYIIGKTPRGFLIKDKIFARTFEQVFDQLWNSAKKINQI